MLVSVAADYFVNITEDGKLLVALIAYKTVKQKNKMLVTLGKTILERKETIL